jgi:hypothetical protein
MNIAATMTIFTEQSEQLLSVDRLAERHFAEIARLRSRGVRVLTLKRSSVAAYLFGLTGIIITLASKTAKKERVMVASRWRIIAVMAGCLSSAAAAICNCAIVAAGPRTQARRLVVFAAASMQTALDVIAQLLQKLGVWDAVAPNARLA